MKTTMLSLSLIFASNLLLAQNYAQVATQAVNVINVNEDSQLGNVAFNNAPIQVNIGNPFSFNGHPQTQKVKQPKPKLVNKQKQVAQQQKMEPIQQMQLQNPGFNPGVQVQGEHMAMQKQSSGVKEARTASGSGASPQVKKLGIPLKYRLRYMRIRVGEKKAFRSGGSGRAFKVGKRSGAKDKCFFASL